MKLSKYFSNTQVHVLARTVKSQFLGSVSLHRIETCVDLGQPHLMRKRGEQWQRRKHTTVSFNVEISLY